MQATYQIHYTLFSVTYLIGFHLMIEDLKFYFSIILKKKYEFSKQIY